MQKPPGRACRDGFVSGEIAGESMVSIYRHLVQCEPALSSAPVRLWSLHPQYLDPSGLVAAWREALLAQAVLRGLTRGYTRHPQLTRFHAQPDAQLAIASYLGGIADEADRRGYSFDRTKIAGAGECTQIAVTTGQLLFEWEHLCAKLRARSPDSLQDILSPLPHPLFVVIDGPVEPWERR
jgi:hypothetical protein